MTEPTHRGSHQLPVTARIPGSLPTTPNPLYFGAQATGRTPGRHVSPLSREHLDWTASGSEWSWPGSRWWRVDLHAHSSASRDFSRPNGGEPDWTAWVEAAARAGLDAIAITDHNTAAGISAIQDAAKAVANAPVLFPGVEITAGGVHLLALMGPECGQEHIDDLLSRVGVPVADRGSDAARSRLTVERILDELGKDVVILGPHVNGPRGIMQQLDGRERLDVLRNPGLAGVEVDPAGGS